MCIFFSVELRFIPEESKTDENTINAFKVALARLTGVDPVSVSLLNNADSGNICGEDIIGGSLSRRLNAHGRIFKYHELTQTESDDDRENHDIMHPRSRIIESGSHLFTGVDDDTTDFRQAKEQAERRHAALIEQGDAKQGRRELGRYNGWLNDPTPNPTLAPTHFPTFRPTTAPDPVTFTTIVYENAGAWDDAITAEDEEERISNALMESIGDRGFEIVMAEAAVSEGSSYLNNPSVFRSIAEVTTDDVQVTVGEDIIYNAPTSAPTTSNPTVSPTLSPATSRPTVPGETNPPTSIPTSSLPTTQPSSLPSAQPTRQPTGQPTSEPTNPTSMPTSMPTHYRIIDEDELTQREKIAVYAGASAAGLVFLYLGYMFYTWLKQRQLGRKTKVRPSGGAKEDEESKFEDPDDIMEVSELDLAAALKIVLKKKGGLYNTKNKYRVPAKAMRKIGLLRDGVSTKIFSAADAGLEKLKKAMEARVASKLSTTAMRREKQLSSEKERHARRLALYMIVMATVQKAMTTKPSYGRRGKGTKRRRRHSIRRLSLSTIAAKIRE